MTTDIYLRLLCLACGIGYFVGLAWSFFTKEDQFASTGNVDRFAASAVIGGTVGAIAVGVIFTMLYGAIYAIYFGILGG